MAELVKERVYDLGDGLGLWKVHLDVLREQDRNARVMSPEKMDRLPQNIKKHKRLESVPLCCRRVTPGGVEEFLIISGHHRVRAARTAGVMVIHVLVFEEELTPGQIRAKQLAHNALNGTDNTQLLAELYRESEDLTERIESGGTDAELEADVKQVGVDEVLAQFDFEGVNLVFLPHQRADYDAVINLLTPNSSGTDVAPLPAFDTFKQALNAVRQKENVRNVAAAVHRMCEIVQEALKASDTDGDPRLDPAQ